MKPSPEGEVIVEFLQLGNLVRVTAMDPKTLREVSIMGPSTAGEQALTRIAVRKLRYVLARQRKRKED